MSIFISKNIPQAKSLFNQLPIDHPISKVLQNYKSCYTINQLCVDIFGINQKRFRKLIQTNLSRNIEDEVILNEELWLFLNLVQKIIPNREKCFYFLNSKNLSQFNINLTPSVIFLLQKNHFEFLSNKHRRKILNLFFTKGDDNTTNESISLIYYGISRKIHKIDSFLYEKNVKKITENNAELATKLALDRKQNIYFKNQEPLLKLQNHTLGNFKIKIPLFNHELLNIGRDLHLCLGEGFYAEKILNNQSNIIILEQNKFTSIVLEVVVSNDSIKILQGKKLFNQNLEKELHVDIQEKLSFLF